MKFIVDVPNYKDVGCMERRIVGINNVLNRNDFTVTELQQPPEVKKIETGIIQMPKYYHLVHYENDSLSGEELNSQKVNLTMYPMFRCLCDPDSIQTQWDFSSIPVGALIEITSNTNGEFHGRFKRYNTIKVYYGISDICIESIKSIRIIETGDKK